MGYYIHASQLCNLIWNKFSYIQSPYLCFVLCNIKSSSVRIYETEKWLLFDTMVNHYLEAMKGQFGVLS